jgi:sugar O-acyltransferase (sialic acid O-acetyltransferase NeuD family)
MGLLNCHEASSVVIAGAGGFGREMFDYLMQSASVGGPVVAGFIDDTPGAPVPAGTGVSHLGRIDDYVPLPDQVVVVAIGTVRGRRSVLERLWQHGVRTPAYIAEYAIVSTSAIIGNGVVVCPYSIINRDAALGDGVAVNVHCSVGHGAVVGSWSVLSPYAALNGDAAIGSECFLGTRSIIYPKIRIGDGCVVDTLAGVRARAPARQMISSRGNYSVTPLRERAENS